MTRRIAIGGFLHESHSFAPRPTTYADFLRPGGFPPLTEGDAMLDAVRGTSVPAAGALAVAEADGAAVVPLAWTTASPAGPIEDEAFERIAALICAALSRALDVAPLDGVYLDLHGAAVVESFPDAEGELLRRVRAMVGDLPLTISLDPHANLTQRMVTLADAVVPFRTYPHIDMKAAGAQAMRLLLQRIDRGEPWARAFRQLEFWIPLGSQCTMLQPMSAVMAERASLAERLDVAELAFCFGFPYADFADCGPALAAYADTQAKADAAADAFAAHVAAREADFVQDVLPAAEAVAEAKRLAVRASKPIVIADTQDNPGGGGHGDTTGLLAELVRQQAKGAVLCLINDAASVAACVAAGEGGSLALVARREVGRVAVGLHGAGAETDRWAVHADRADGGGQSRQSGSVRADRHRRRSGDGGVAQDAGARPGDPAPCRGGAERVPDPGAEVVGALPCGLWTDRGEHHRGDCAWPRGGRSGDPEFPLRAPRCAAPAANRMTRFSQHSPAHLQATVFSPDCAGSCRWWSSARSRVGSRQWYGSRSRAAA